ETLAAEGVAVSSPPVPDADTGTCLVLLEPSAERTFITVQGAERRITVASLATARPAPGDVVCVSGYSMFGATRDPLVAWLGQLPVDALVVVDPGAPFAELDDATLDACLRRTGVWTGNADEADDLARRAAGDPLRAPGTEAMPIADAAPAVAAALPDGAVVVVRDGPAGCVVHADGRTTTFPGFPQTPVDTNGAGDTHTGVLVAELANGSGWDLAATRANAAGAIKVTRRGPATAPTAAATDACRAEQPWELEVTVTIPLGAVSRSMVRAAASAGVIAGPSGRRRSPRSLRGSAVLPLLARTESSPSPRARPRPAAGRALIR